MRRRSSGSAAEEEGEDPPAPATYVDVSSAGEVAGGKAEDSTSKDSSNVQTTPLPSDTQHTPHELDRRKSTIARSRRPSNTNWKPVESRNGSIDKKTIRSTDLSVIAMSSKEAHITDRMPETRRPGRLRSPWSISYLTLVTTGVALLVLASIVHSFSNRQLDPKGCRMSYMRPSFAKLSDFDTEHTRFASKYSVYLYREGMVDEDTKV
jgi:glycosylphosphatidylinositol deacylase